MGNLQDMSTVSMETAERRGVGWVRGADGGVESGGESWGLESL